MSKAANGKQNSDNKPLMTIKQILKSACTVKKGRFNFEIIASNPPSDVAGHVSFSTDDEFVYDSFVKDNGPLKLSDIYKYCIKVDQLLQDPNNRSVLHFTTCKHSGRTNAALLFAAYAIIRLSYTADTIYQKLTNSKRQRSFPLYRDASHNDSSRKLTLLSVLHSIEIAVLEGIFNFQTFNVEQVDYYEEVINGDLNWIVPGKLLAFAGPHNTYEERADGTVHHTPEQYFEYFKKNNVEAIVRLNRKSYDEQRFVKEGFNHYDLIYLDGSIPTDEHVLRFLSICQQTKGAIAVHCKAGLGRTGTMISCYLISYYSMSAAEAIAWCRVCRPGSVINPQQEYLSSRQNWLFGLWDSSKLYRTEKVKSIRSTNGQKGQKESGLSQGDELNIIKSTRKQLVLN